MVTGGVNNAQNAGYTTGTQNAGYAAGAQNVKAGAQADKTQTTKTTEAAAVQTSQIKYGNTIGNPKLSDQALKYYEKLKKKYSNMDFVLVSPEEKAKAEASAGNYANKDRMVVLIDTDKIERMATDESYRKKYEGIIGGAASQMSQLKTSLGSAAASVKTFGMKVNDGGNASFFAVVDKSMAAQKKRIEEKAEQKAEAKKKAQKEAAKERLEKHKTDKDAGHTDSIEESDTITITASSIEELLQKIEDIVYEEMSDNTQTDEEKKVGQNINYSV